MEPASFSLSMPRETAERMMEATASGSPAHLTGNMQVTPRESFEISDQDREILLLLGEDNTIAQVAEKLGRAESTVQLRIRHLKTKLGCRGLAGLVATALRKRIID